MAFIFPNGARRPVIDINSENLMFVWNLPRWVDVSEIKRTLQPKYGRIKFVETFEAWREGRRLGQIIVDFASYGSLSAFTKALSNKEEFNYEGVEFMCFDPKIGQRPFFNFVRQQTGVDLMACGGVPPTFDYRRKGPSGERQQNPNNTSRPRLRDSFVQTSRGFERGRHDRDNIDYNGRLNGSAQERPSPRGVGRGFGQIGSRFGNRSDFAPPPSHSDEPKRTAAEEKEPEKWNEHEDENYRPDSLFEQKNCEGEDEQNRRSDSPSGDFGSNPPSRLFSQRIGRPKPSFFDEKRSSQGFFSDVGDVERNECQVEKVSQAAEVDDLLLGLDETCQESDEVDSSFGGATGENDDEAEEPVEKEQQEEEKEEGDEERDEGKVTPTADDDGEESANKSDERTTESSFTQYREKSRSREDSISEERGGHGDAGVKNTLKITQLDFCFDIAKILEALQTVGEVVRFERLGKTSAAFTFDDAAEAANASVLVVDDLAAPNAHFQLMTAEEAYQYQ